MMLSCSFLVEGKHRNKLYPYSLKSLGLKPLVWTVDSEWVGNCVYRPLHKPFMGIY